MEVKSMDFVHPTEELLEEYCFKRVTEPVLSGLEEHLLICEVCRDEVAGLDAYIVQLKSALCPEGGSTGARLRVRREGSRPAGPAWHDLPARPILPRLAGISMVAMVLLGAGVWGWQKLPTRPSSIEMASVRRTVVELKALRGGSERDAVNGGDLALAAGGPAGTGTSGRYNRANAGEILQLRVDRTRLPSLAEPRMEVVDPAGRRIWAGNAQVENGYLTASLQKSLLHGKYWVRLYSGSGELVREFALRLDP